MINQNKYTLSGLLAFSILYILLSLQPIVYSTYVLFVHTIYCWMLVVRSIVVRFVNVTTARGPRHRFEYKNSHNLERMDSGERRAIKIASVICLSTICALCAPINNIEHNACKVFVFITKLLNDSMNSCEVWRAPCDDKILWHPNLLLSRDFNLQTRCKCCRIIL